MGGDPRTQHSDHWELDSSLDESVGVGGPTGQSGLQGMVTPGAQSRVGHTGSLQALRANVCVPHQGPSRYSWIFYHHGLPALWSIPHLCRACLPSPLRPPYLPAVAGAQPGPRAAGDVSEASPTLTVPGLRMEPPSPVRSDIMPIGPAWAGGASPTLRPTPGQGSSRSDPGGAVTLALTCLFTLRNMLP